MNEELEEEYEMLEALLSLRNEYQKRNAILERLKSCMNFEGINPNCFYFDFERSRMVNIVGDTNLDGEDYISTNEVMSNAIFERNIGSFDEIVNGDAIEKWNLRNDLPPKIVDEEEFKKSIQELKKEGYFNDDCFHYPYGTDINKKTNEIFFRNNSYYIAYSLNNNELTIKSNNFGNLLLTRNFVNNSLKSFLTASKPKYKFTSWQREIIDKNLNNNKAIVIKTNNVPLISLGSVRFNVKENDNEIIFEKIKKKKRKVTSRGIY